MQNQDKYEDGAARVASRLAVAAPGLSVSPVSCLASCLIRSHSISTRQPQLVAVRSELYSVHSSYQIGQKGVDQYLTVINNTCIPVVMTLFVGSPLH